MRSDITLENDNVIDMTSRIQEPEAKKRLQGLKVRLDLEQAKIAVSTSLLSIVILVTLANNNLMSSVPAQSVSNMASSASVSRGIASVGQEEVNVAREQDAQLVKNLSDRELSPGASIGRRPSSLETLAFEYLEGKYAVRLKDGKISEIEFTDASADHPKHVDDLGSFLTSHRDLLPNGFEKSAKVKSNNEGTQTTEIYELRNQYSQPVANVQFRMDAAGRLLAMQVEPVRAPSSAPFEK